MIFGAFFFIVSLLPIIIVILVLLRIVRTLEGISTDIRRIADRADTPERAQTPE